MSTSQPAVRIAVHKFSSCDGCQLAFLNMGEDLLTLAGRVQIVHFAEAGALAADARVDIAFVEGSINTAEDLERIREIRENSHYLVTIGACATAGGLQALRNITDSRSWLGAVYASPEYVDSLERVAPIRDHVKVDLELWGCPVNSRQVKAAITSLLSGATPAPEQQKVCMECKRQGAVCVLVTQGTPCMGPVTQTGCGAICPRFGRDCYGCYGPAETANTAALASRFAGLGLMPREVVDRFLSFTNAAPAFLDEGLIWKQRHD